ncbi:RNA methyltransferase [candidate division KSB1 bacterium]|nr:RNA methyltransferase [candidate division KSB1 bacterium]
MNKISYLDIIQGTPSHETVRQKPRRPVTVLCDNIRSLYNVGSIFRTADAVGAEKLILTGISGCPPRAEIHKAALGAEQIVPWEYVKQPEVAIQQLKQAGYKIVVLEHTDSGKDVHEAEYNYPMCLVAGHEITGVSDEVIALADMAVEIPMFGLKQSLNVSVAFGIAIFEIIHHLPHLPDNR